VIEIHLRDKKVEFDFILTSKYTVLVGKSGTGKTTFCNRVAAYEMEPELIECLGYEKLRVMPLRTSLKAYEAVLKDSDYVFVIDDDSYLLRLKGYRSLLNESDNYFLIMSRKDGVIREEHDVFEMVNDNGFHTLKQYSEDW
jgi:septin family protein